MTDQEIANNVKKHFNNSLNCISELRKRGYMITLNMLIDGSYENFEIHNKLILTIYKRQTIYL